MFRCIFYQRDVSPGVTQEEGKHGGVFCFYREQNVGHVSYGYMASPNPRCVCVFFLNLLILGGEI